jgi:hypothetical protein
MYCAQIATPGMNSTFRLKRTFASSGQAFDVIRGGRVVGYIKLCDDSPASRWAWTFAYKYQESGARTHGYEPNREAAMQAFARSWNRES